jgi:hypothetical protein
MSYKHEIFISYKWGKSRKEWVDTIFVPILEEALEYEFGTKQTVFKDTNNIVPGASLDLSLRDALAHSKCMVCIVSLQYFTQSVWCPTEFSAMLYREEKTGIRNKGNHCGFIFPIIFIDEEEAEIPKKSPLYEYEKLRDLIFNILPLELDNEKFNNTNKAFQDSNNYNELRNKIRKWVKKSIKPVLENIEPWNQEWDTDEYITQPFEIFKMNYDEVIKPMPLPSVR